LLAMEDAGLSSYQRPVMALNGHAEIASRCPLLRDERT
jgi:hypothetical protein